MTDADVMTRFGKIVGFGSVRGPYPNGKGHKDRWVWQVQTFEKTQALVAMFWPWLGERRRARAVEVLRADRTRDARSSRPKQWFGKTVSAMSRDEYNNYQRRRRDERTS
jgi:hypothetical protein